VRPVRGVRLRPPDPEAAVREPDVPPLKAQGLIDPGPGEGERRDERPPPRDGPAEVLRVEGAGRVEEGGDAVRRITKANIFILPDGREKALGANPTSVLPREEPVTRGR
jgi:hypothetical protein